MESKELDIPHSYVITPTQHRDDRGSFLEWFQNSRFEELTGRTFDLKQANTSVSKRGVVRGIHFAQVGPSQAKYVTCPSGRVLDYIIDIRLGSPTYGEYTTVELNDELRNAVFLSEGLGHMFVTLSDTAVVSYLVNQPFNPGREHPISPLDESLALDIPVDRAELLFSPKDEAAPSLTQVHDAGLLPLWSECLDLYASLAPRGDGN